MPRRNANAVPPEDQGGPSPQRLSARRERRKARREAKSPNQGLDGGTLTAVERVRLERMCAEEVSRGDEIRAGALRRELLGDREARAKHRPSF